MILVLPAGSKFVAFDFEYFLCKNSSFGGP
jgi:hypothetical protein